MQAHLRNIKISQKKANVVAGLVRGKAVAEALDILKYTPKKSANMLYKVVQSAAANAEHNDGVTMDTLMIDQIVVNRAGYTKRFLPSIRGRVLPLRKPTAHISVYLKTTA